MDSRENPPRWSRIATVGFLLVLLQVGCSDSTPHPQEEEVRSFIERYFQTWSDQDMDGYGDCFHPHARISYLPLDQAEPRTDSLSDFLFGQRMGHKTSPEPMIEVPLSMVIHMEDRAAQAFVRWELTKGGEITVGTDFFTLIHTPQGWKIIHLVFYADE